MEKEREIFALYKSEAEKEAIIVDNILKMLSNRTFEDNDVMHPILKLKDARNAVSNVGENTWSVDGLDGKKYAFKIVFQEITTSSKQSPIRDFLDKYKASHYCIVVAPEFKKKIKKEVNSLTSQIFKERSLLEDIAANSMQPKYEKLGTRQRQQTLDEYNSTNRDLTTINRKDPMSRYHGLVKGDIVRIERPSPATMVEIGYRIVK